MVSGVMLPPTRRASQAVIRPPAAPARRIRVRRAPSAGLEVRPPGFDIAEGSTLLRAGDVLGAAELGLLGYAGAPAVQVRRAARVAHRRTRVITSRRFAVSSVIRPCRWFWPRPSQGAPLYVSARPSRAMAVSCSCGSKNAITPRSNSMCWAVVLAAVVPAAAGQVRCRARQNNSFSGRHVPEHHQAAAPCLSRPYATRAWGSPLH